MSEGRQLFTLPIYCEVVRGLLEGKPDDGQATEPNTTRSRIGCAKAAPSSSGIECPLERRLPDSDWTTSDVKAYLPVGGRQNLRRQCGHTAPET